MMKTYRELNRLKTFLDRYRYLRLGGIVGRETFGFDRYLNQLLYKSDDWLEARDKVIIRDLGCDLSLDDYEIHGTIIVHHMNPITIEDIEKRNANIFNNDLLVCTSINTHNAIHYGNESLLPKPHIDRRRNDTSPWL